MGGLGFVLDLMPEALAPRCVDPLFQVLFQGWVAQVDPADDSGYRRVPARHFQQRVPLGIESACFNVNDNGQETPEAACYDIFLQLSNNLARERGDSLAPNRANR